MKRHTIVLGIGVILFGEVVLFVYYYGTSAHGYIKIKELQEHKELLASELIQLHDQVRDLEKRLEDTRTYPYYKEKIIREQLQMMHQDEVLYKR